jgi:hypothetical protein
MEASLKTTEVVDRAHPDILTHRLKLTCHDVKNGLTEMFSGVRLPVPDVEDAAHLSPWTNRLR